MNSTSLRRRTLFAGLGAATLAAWSFGAPAQAQALPAEVRIGFQKGAAILVLARKRQVIETRLKALGVNSVKWVEFQFGPPLLEAMGAGSVDLGAVGDTPPIFAQAGGSNLVYVAATPSAQHAVLVPQDSPIRTLAELKGRRVAFGKGSSAQNVAIKALALGGLTLKDVEATYLSPADATGIDAKTWSTAFGRADFSFGPVTPAHVAQQQQLADAFQSLAIIPRRINVADIVWQAPRP